MTSQKYEQKASKYERMKTLLVIEPQGNFLAYAQGAMRKEILRNVPYDLKSEEKQAKDLTEAEDTNQIMTLSRRDNNTLSVLRRDFNPQCQERSKDNSRDHFEGKQCSTAGRDLVIELLIGKEEIEVRNSEAGSLEGTSTSFENKLVEDCANIQDQLLKKSTLETHQQVTCHLRGGGPDTSLSGCSVSEELLSKLTQ